MPGGSDGSTNHPFSFVVEDRVNVVSLAVKRTSTPGITPPEGSNTKPVIAPVAAVCPHAWLTKQRLVVITIRSDEHRKQRCRPRPGAFMHSSISEPIPAETHRITTKHATTAC